MPMVTLPMTFNAPKPPHFLHFVPPFNRTAVHRLQIWYIGPTLLIKKSSLKLAWSGSRGLRKFRLSKSSVYRCYQRSRRGSASGLRPTTVERVVAECTSWSLLDLSYKLFLHCYAAVAKNSCVSAIAEFLLDTVVRATS